MRPIIALQHAEICARRGWPVFPVCPPTADGRCGCPSSNQHAGHDVGKAPARGIGLRNGLKDATTDEAMIRGWWARLPDAGIGLDLEAAGLVDIAPDSRHWHAVFGERGLPETASFRSGGGDGHVHYLYRRPEGCPVRRLCKPGAYDILSAGYAVLPPSRHATTGEVRTWLVGPDDVAALPEAPAWAVDLLRRAAAPEPAPQHGSSGGAPPVRLDAEAQRWWTGEAVKRRPDGEVDRSATLQAIAYRLARAGASEAAIAAALAERDVSLGFHKYADRRDGYAEYARSALKAEAAAEAAPARPVPDDGPPEAAGDDRGRKSQATLAVELALAAGIELFHTPGGEPFATVPVGDHAETYPTRSTAFRRWLERIFFQETGKSLNGAARVDATGVLEGKALFDGPEHPVFVRVAEVGGAVYLDLGDPAWRAVHITADGWDVVGAPPVKFRRPAGLLPLPEPQRGGTVAELFAYLNVADPQNQMLVTAWLVAALRGTGPYPVLTFTGEQGAAKSTAVRVCAALLDPGVAKLRTEPKEPRDFMIAATNGWVLALDNLSRLPEWLSDGLCRLATGGGFATRTLYTDNEETIFEVQRPVVLNGITEFVTRPDLLDRTIIVTLPAIPDERRRPERDFWRAFEAARPRIQGALYDAVAASLRDEGAVRLARLPRMADFAVRAAAAAPALGWEPGSFLAAYSTNRAEANAAVLEESPVPDLIIDKALHGFEGTATELLAALEHVADEKMIRSQSWPKTPRSLSNLLRRLTPNLRAAGVLVEFGTAGRGRAKRRIITVRRARDHQEERDGIVPSPPSPPPPGGREARSQTGFVGDVRGDANPRLGTQGALFASPAAASPRAAGDAGDGGDDRDPSRSDHAACTICGAELAMYTQGGEPHCTAHAGEAGADDRAAE